MNTRTSEHQDTDAPVTNNGQLLKPSDYNTARAAGLNVNWPAESVFNNAVARFAAAVREPMLARIEVLSGSVRAAMAEIDRVKLENAELRQMLNANAHIVIRLPADDTEGGAL